MQSALVVIGINHRMAPLAVRERFWMDRDHRTEALVTLSQAEAIEEVFVFSTCQRTEFVLWGDPTLAINSVLRFLTSKYDLKLSDWNSFYRLLDETALAHAFRVSSGLDSMSLGEGHIARQADEAWRHARDSGSTGPHLNAVLRRALAVRRRVLKQTAVGSQFVSAPHAAVELARKVLGSVTNRSAVVIGAGSMGELAVQALRDRGAELVWIISRNDKHAAELAEKLGVQWVSFGQRYALLANAEIIISAVSGASQVITADEIAQTASRKCLLIDLAFPRSIDRAIKEIPGPSLYDLDDLEHAIKTPAAASESEIEAQRIILEEVMAFRSELLALDKAPGIGALKQRLDEICRQELESFRLERGPFPKDQDRLLAAVGNRITHRIAGSLTRELNDGSQFAERIKAAV